MNNYQKVFKYNLFNQIYFPIILTIYLITFITDQPKYDIKAIIMSVIVVIIPMIIAMILALIKTVNFKSIIKGPKILLITSVFLPFCAGLIMLFTNKYFVKNLIEPFDLTDNSKQIYRNILISSIYLIILILFAIIYVILDNTIKSNQLTAEIFASLSIFSLFLFLFDYLLLFFYVINNEQDKIKTKILLCIFWFNIYYFKKNIGSLKKKIIL